MVKTFIPFGNPHQFGFLLVTTTLVELVLYSATFFFLHYYERFTGLFFFSVWLHYVSVLIQVCMCFKFSGSVCKCMYTFSQVIMVTGFNAYMQVAFHFKHKLLISPQSFISFKIILQLIFSKLDLNLSFLRIPRKTNNPYIDMLSILSES